MNFIRDETGIPTQVRVFEQADKHAVEAAELQSLDSGSRNKDFGGNLEGKVSNITPIRKARYRLTSTQSILTRSLGNIKPGMPDPTWSIR